MKQSTQKRLKRTAIIAAIALVIGAGIGFMEARKEVTNKVRSHKVAGISLGGDFTLVNHKGVTVTQDNYAGKYKLIFFGFTSCPMVCPVELQKITTALTSIQSTNPEVLEKIQPLFITTDPERDTPEVMSEYVDMFHAKIIGLTGSSEQVQEVIQAYRIYAQKAEVEAGNDPMDYDMDHSAYTYLMSPDNELISIYRMEDTADYIAGDVLGKL